jgi:ABC-type transport system substrate-binding protein
LACKRGGGTAENPKAAHYCNPAEMPLINALSVEPDPAKRKKMLHEALAALTENAPIIFLVEFKETMGFNPKIKNFSHINLWIPYEELRIDG